MLITSWYYDERDQMFKKTSLEELLSSKLNTASSVTLKQVFYSA